MPLLSESDATRQSLTRRHFFARSSAGIGVAALSHLLGARASASAGSPLHRPARAKRVIFLFQSGGPSQFELFDHKPSLAKWHGSELPDSVRGGQRLTGMTSGQSSFPVAASKYGFRQHGQSGTWVSDLLPHTAKVADNLCIVNSLHTDAINHDPAITLMQTGSQQPGRASMGSWVSYGLGSENEELPSFVVLISMTKGKPNPQGLLTRLWTNGFLPSQHQGVKLRSQGDPVLYLSDPPGIDRSLRRDMLDGIGALNRMQFEQVGDAEITARIAQYEMAFRMQASVPELTNFSGESLSTLALYGPEAQKPGTFASNCLLARRLAERGVRFIQLYHRGWDQHGQLPQHLPVLCQETDQPAAALIQDLEQRGMLDETLVVWAGEFGRTTYCQGQLTHETYGRDHHPRCFSGWLAGGGTRGGITYGKTDDFSYNVAQSPVHVHDLQATILHCMGIDHEQLTFRYQGRDHRLTDVHGEVVAPILARSAI